MNKKVDNFFPLSVYFNPRIVKIVMDHQSSAKHVDLFSYNCSAEVAESGIPQNHDSVHS